MRIHGAVFSSHSSFDGVISVIVGCWGFAIRSLLLIRLLQSVALGLRPLVDMFVDLYC